MSTSRLSGALTPSPKQQRRPYYNKFPWFGNILQYSNVGYSNYHALQMNLVERNTHGLTTSVAYTLAHAMTTQSGESDNFPFLKDSTNVSSSYAPMNSTPEHHLGITVTYDIPGRKGFGQMLQGWSVNSTVNYLSGTGVDLHDFIIDFSRHWQYLSVPGKLLESVRERQRLQQNLWPHDAGSIFQRSNGVALPQACISGGGG